MPRSSARNAKKPRRKAAAQTPASPSVTTIEPAALGDVATNQSVVILTGSGGDTWPAFARSLAPAPARQRPKQARSGRIAPENPSLQLRVVAQADAELPELLARHRDARIAAFWESPLDAIVNGMRSGGPGTCAQTLDQWVGQTSSLLALWRRDRQRLLLLSCEECLAAPAAAVDRLSAFVGSPLLVEHGAVPASIPLSSPARLLAEATVKRHREAFRVWQELSAASQPLSPDGPHAVSDPAAALGDALRLEEAARNEAKLCAEMEAVQATHAEHCEMLLQEVRNAHGEAEDFFEQLTQARADAEAVNRQLDQSRTLLLEAEQAKHALEAERDEAKHRISQLHAELGTLGQSALDTQENLLQEIQNAHRESEDFFEQWKSLEAATLPEHFVAGRIVRGGEKHQPPHNHIDYTFDGGTLFERHWPQLRVRLVEHGGNAGIVIFATAGTPTHPLYHWEPDGKENGADYMLFVPRDKRSTAKLVGLPASDLILVRSLAAKMLGHLCVHGGDSGERWSGVARRLLQEIDEIPERLHYDSVTGHAERKDGKEGIRFTAVKLTYRGDCAPSYGLHWSPGPHGGKLRAGPDATDARMLPSCGGEAAVGFESNEDTSSLEKLWPLLTARDRTFLLLLTKALPDFVYHLCQQQPDHRPDKERLTKQAKALYGKLRAFDRRQRSRGMLAKLLSKGAKIPCSCLFAASVLI